MRSVGVIMFSLPQTDLLTLDTDHSTCFPSPHSHTHVGRHYRAFPVLPSSILSPERPVRSNPDAKWTEESVLIREVAYLERKGIPF